MAINLTVVVLYAINSWLRMRSPGNVSPGLSTPVLFSIVGIALLFVPSSEDGIAALPQLSREVVGETLPRIANVRRIR